MVNDIVKIEFKELLKNKIVWLMGIVYIFGIEESIRLMFNSGQWLGGFICYLKTSWLPLNLIMLPLLIVAYITGKKEIEDVNKLEVSEDKKNLGKVIAISIVSLVVFMISISISIIVAKISNISFGYFINLFIFYVISVTLFLLVVNCIGLYIGIMTKNRRGYVIDAVILFIIFILLTSFGRDRALISTVYFFTPLSSSFNIIELDIKLVSKIIIWISLCIFFVSTAWLKIKNKRNKLIYATTIISVIAIVASGVVYFKNQTSLYNIERKKEIMNMPNGTYHAKSNIGYSVLKYDMNIKFDNYIKNNCKMQIEINKDNINELVFGLYYKLNVKSVKIDGQDTNFNQENNKVKIDLENNKNTGDKIEVEIIYEGNTDARLEQGEDKFYVNKNSIFLADVFEWYPKLNDNKEKEYEINVDYKSKNKLYSNLDITNEGKYKGKDNEIYFVSGNIEEKEFDGYRLIGNEEYINTEEQCKVIVEQVDMRKKYIKNGETIKDILFVPDILGMNVTWYKNGYFFDDSDTDCIIRNKSREMYDWSEDNFKKFYKEEY